MKIHHIDQTIQPPTKRNGSTAAWHIDIAAQEAVSTGAPHSSLDGWVVFAPWAHMLWSYYHIALVHLRDVPGLKPAVVHLPGATHEIILMALSPDKAPNLLRPQSTMLRPLNYAGQFIDTDENAIKRTEEVVDGILNGVISPDTDFIQQWVALFGGAMLKQF